MIPTSKLEVFGEKVQHIPEKKSPFNGLGTFLFMELDGTQESWCILDSEVCLFTIKYSGEYPKMSKMFNTDIQGVNVFQVVMYFLKKVLTIEILEHTKYFVTL